MRIQPPRRRKAQDPTIALINIVFLMLIFFLLAGTIAAGTDRDIELIRTSEAEGTRPPAEALGITGAGELRYGGAAVEMEALLAALSGTRAAPQAGAEAAAGAGGETLDIVADRALPARSLIAVLRELGEAGYTTRIVTRSGGRI